MKILIVLYAGSVTAHAFDKNFGGECAFERSLSWAQTVGSAARIDVFTSTLSAEFAPAEFTLQSEQIPLETVFENSWTAASLLKQVASRSAGFDAVVFAWADRPFYDQKLTEKLLETHLKYGAEYTFADGYPSGLTPEIIHPSSAALIAELAKDENVPVCRDVFFSVLKKDLNAFEIETLIAPKDLRYLRLDCSCSSKRDTLSCSRLFEACGGTCTAESVCAVAEKSAGVQRTLPAFYAVQIASACTGGCSFCPYPAQYEKKYGENPARSKNFMSLDNFRCLVKHIAEFSEDAVVSLSLWGDALLHPQFTDFAAAVLEEPALSLLIETDASALTAETAQKIAETVKKAPERTNGQKPVNWIIALDAAEAGMYKQLHGFDGFEHAAASVETLRALFPGAVYPQFVRLKENEEQLESFYRYWKEKTGNLIVQKYDWFSGLLEDKKVADLTPVERKPCWHLRRDVCILPDGAVSRCKCAFFEGDLGNAFTERLETIWNRSEKSYEEHVSGRYSGICERCDEYYTFNF